MPGYEIYHSDGTLLVRCREIKNGVAVGIPNPKLHALAATMAPEEPANSLQIKVLGNGVYAQSKTDQKNLGVPNHNGTRISNAAWQAKIAGFKSQLESLPGSKIKK